MKSVSALAILALSFMIAQTGCAHGERPVLYPNDHLKQVGQDQAQTDIDECMKLATEYGADSSAGGKVAKDTAGGAVIGGAVGAATGAVLGSVGRGLAAGAAGGAAGGLARGALASDQKDPVFRQFVDRCLREKGYEPIGWR
ncbi:MAG TPA: hypothetical protein VMU60_08580 [Syntrophobacteria bacterium]|nr:hypothetical protein [Syntrophobacteria bacterium]